MQAAQLAPTLTELVPWTDRRGRFHPLRAVTFTLLTLPAAWLLFRWAGHMLGPRAVNTATHSTGYWTIWLLIASLCVTPLKALSAMPNVVVVRRMVGNAALAYGALHLTLYAIDQNWRIATIVTEILSRFYLTIGFVALLGLTALGVTSTDGWIRALGRSWKRLHRIVYGIAVLGLFHYMLQSKLDVSQALLAVGVFTWLALWRMLPAGRDREWRPLLGLALMAAAMTVAAEYAWYRFGTKINPLKVVYSELDVEYGLHPAGQVLALGLLAVGLTELRRIAQAPFGQRVWFTMFVFALGALVDDLAALFMGWSLDDVTPDGSSRVLLDLAWMALLALAGMARWRLRRDWRRHLLDGFWVACVLYHVVMAATGNRNLGASSAMLVLVAAALLGTQVWRVSHMAALLLVPLGGLLAYEAVTLL
jgi:sulfoxide reductase heme-binding subunit YedZ